MTERREKSAMAAVDLSGRKAAHRVSGQYPLHGIKYSVSWNNQNSHRGGVTC